MTTERGRGGMHHVGSLFDVGTMGSLTDAELLDRFVRRGGEASELAFAALVERHGAMVLRVCRRSLGDRDEALDAFQATFLVLATKAGSLRRRESLGSWLYGVALRVARCARSSATRRRSHERRRAEGASTVIEDPRPLGDERAVVREEFDRLPERYRAAIALCDLDDLTHEEAADQLGWPVGTVKSRLARGRAALRDRLARRGLAPMAVLSPMVPRTALPPGAADTLARMASKIAAGAPMAGTVPASTSALVEGVRRMMLLEALRRGVLAAVGLVALSVGLVLAADGPAPKRPTAGAAGPKEERQISHEVRLCSIGGRGPEWRNDFADCPGFRLLGVRPPFTAWTIDREALRRILVACQARADANIVQAPKVTTFDGAQATVISATQWGLAARGLPTTSFGTTSGFLAPAPGTGLDAALAQASHESRPDGLPEGLAVQMTGTVVDRKVRLKVDIETSHVVTVHEAVMPGSGRLGEADPPAKLQLPEIERARLQGEWTVDDGQTLLLSLGIVRSIDDRGKESTREMLVLVTPRIIVLEAEVVRPGR